MKQSLFIAFTFLFVSIAIEQNRYSTVTPSSYEPRSYDEMSNLAMTLKKRYDQNQKYLYNMKKWIWN
jgi:hypothetical protein